MRRSDILLALLVVVLAVGLILGPPLWKKWRDSERDLEAPPVAAEEPLPVERKTDAAEVENAELSERAEVERVSGMLMLYNACANRIDGFDDRHRAVFETWKQRHADTLAKRGSELDFHIVLADPEGMERDQDEKAREEERLLCERNVEAMQAGKGGQAPR